MPKAEGLKLDYGSEDLINPKYLETFPFDSPNQYIITETDEFSAVCPFSGLPDYSYLKIEYFPAFTLLSFITTSSEKLILVLAFAPVLHILL